MPVQAEAALAELGGEDPVAAAAKLRELAGALEEGGPEEEAAAAPTMMSREARQLMLSGQGAAGLAAWKVGGDPLGMLAQTCVTSCSSLTADARWVSVLEAVQGYK